MGEIPFSDIAALPGCTLISQVLLNLRVTMEMSLWSAPDSLVALYWSGWDKVGKGSTLKPLLQARKMGLSKVWILGERWQGGGEGAFSRVTLRKGGLRQARVCGSAGCMFSPSSSLRARAAA